MSAKSLRRFHIKQRKKRYLPNRQSRGAYHSYGSFPSTILGHRYASEHPGAGRQFPYHRDPFRRRSCFGQIITGILAQLMDSDWPLRHPLVLA